MRHSNSFTHEPLWVMTHTPGLSSSITFFFLTNSLLSYKLYRYGDNIRQIMGVDETWFPLLALSITHKRKMPHHPLGCRDAWSLVQVHPCVPTFPSHLFSAAETWCYPQRPRPKVTSLPQPSQNWVLR